MMEQESLFNKSPEISAYEKIEPELMALVSQKGADPAALTCGRRQNYYSVIYGSSVVCRIADAGAKRRAYISLADTALSGLYGYQQYIESRQDGFSRIFVDSLDELKDHLPIIRYALVQAIDSSAQKEFDCCSRYEQCSNAKSCVHPDKAMAQKCGYRRILASGRIFYGQNRNID